MLSNLAESYREIYEARDPKDKEGAAKRLAAHAANPSSTYKKAEPKKDINKLMGIMNDPWKGDREANKAFARRFMNDGDIKEEVVNYLIDEGFASNDDSALVMLEHMSDEWLDSVLNEMRKEDKVAGKKSGGSSNLAYREVANMMRGMQGKPAGQQKKVPGKKPPAAGERGGPMSPKTKVGINRARREEGERNQSSRFD